MRPIDTKNFSSLTWACRRGMLELDVLLLNFLKERFNMADESTQADFVQLLSCEDPDLYRWLVQALTPEDTRLIGIVNLVREHANQRI